MKISIPITASKIPLNFLPPLFFYYSDNNRNRSSNKPYVNRRTSSTNKWNNLFIINIKTEGLSFCKKQPLVHHSFPIPRKNVKSIVTLRFISGSFNALNKSIYDVDLSVSIVFTSCKPCVTFLLKSFNSSTGNSPVIRKRSLRFSKIVAYSGLFACFTTFAIASSFCFVSAFNISNTPLSWCVAKNSILFNMASLFSLIRSITSEILLSLTSCSDNSIFLIFVIGLAILFHLTFWESIISTIPFLLHLHTDLWLAVAAPEIMIGERAFPFF